MRIALSALALIALTFPALAAEDAKLVAEGKRLATINCTRCHNIEAEGESPLTDSPPFREIAKNYDREELIGAIADYIIFESRNAPELTFEMVEAPRERAFWLQVRGIRPDPHEGTSTSILPNSALPYLA